MNVQNFIKSKGAFILLLALAITFSFLFYGKVIIGPNNYMFNTGGDAIKNYYTYAYYIKHNNSYTNFEGMNHPYGENFMYTDCHPILASVLKFLGESNPIVHNYSVGIMNFLMIFSIFLTFIVLYYLLIELKIKPWFSVLFSITITLLAPQLFRLEGHFALSYSFAIPLSWLLVLKWFNQQNKFILLLLFINNILWMFVHAYLGIVVLSFVISLFIVKILFDDEKRKHIISYVLLLSSILLPILIFYSFTTLIDTHEGRTNNPSGFFLYNAELDDVFIPHEKPFGIILNKMVGGIIKLEWEARGYVGIINTIFFITIVIISLISIFRKRSRLFLSTVFSNRTINISLIAASIVLLFALGIPFKQFPDLLDVFPVFKQFRATGRFVWPFYFVFTAFAAYYFQQLVDRFLNSSNKAKGFILLTIIFSVLFIEGIFYHKNVASRITRKANLFHEKYVSNSYKEKLDEINVNSYQAIISLPYYYLGSESYARPCHDAAIRNSILVSYHTGLPIVNARLTRTSIEESKRIVQVVTPNYYSKNILNDFDSDKPFIIVKTGKELTKYEKLIYKKAVLLFETPDYEILEISFDDLFSDDRENVFKHFNNIKDSLIKNDGFYISDSSNFLFYRDFNNEKQIDKSYRGTSCYNGKKSGKNDLISFSPNTFKAGSEYHISAWMHNGEPDALNMWFRLIIAEHYKEENKWIETAIVAEQSEVIAGDWSLIEGVFSVKDQNNKIYIFTKGGEHCKASLYIDDLFIKPNGIDVFRLWEDGSLFFNNHKIVN